MSGASDLLASGREVGRLVWTESRLFEVTGRWIATTPEPTARAFWALASGHHGWRAEQLVGLLPEVAGGPTCAELVTPSPESAHILGDIDSIASTRDRVGGVWLPVLSAYLSAAEAHIGASSPLAEAASHRVLRLVVADSRSDIAAAEALIGRLADSR